MNDPDFSKRHLHIIGLGLMGGSLAMALRGKVGYITAEDIDADVLRQAHDNGVIDAAGSQPEADIIVLAAPPLAILDRVPTIAPKRGALVIDLGSTKKTICQALDGLPDNVLAVGGHPMCGLAENGYHNAIHTLYGGARFVLCETERTTPQARQMAETLIKAVGAQPLWLERDHHDFLVALTSHVPHLLSFALMRLAMEIGQDEAGLFDLAAGGFDGATRLARTNESMIVGMFGTNPEHIRTLMSQLRTQLDALETLLGDAPALEQELSRIVEARRAYSENYRERPIA